MKRDDVLDKIFELEFCEPSDKVSKDQALQAAFSEAVTQTGTPLYVLQPAFLKVYPKYRAARLAKELPNIPADTRKA